MRTLFVVRSSVFAPCLLTMATWYRVVFFPIRYFVFEKSADGMAALIPSLRVVHVGHDDEEGFYSSAKIS
jgi:hypothetical protein